MTKKTHETEPIKEQHFDEKKIYSPIENIQKIEGVEIKTDSYQISTFPKGIRIIGYFMFGFIFVLLLLVIVINFFG